MTSRRGFLAAGAALGVGSVPALLPQQAAGGVFNVADYDGSIHAASAAAHAGGGVLYLPAGDYNLTEPLTVNPWRVSLVGDGPQLSTIHANLPAGQYAITLGWSSATAQGGWKGPFDAITGIRLLSGSGAWPTGAGHCNGILIESTNGHAHSMTLRNVSLQGFDTQLRLGANVYLTTLHRVFFSWPNAYGVYMDDPANAGELVTFDGCVFAGGPGTAVYLNKSGAGLRFNSCSFDYMKRAVWQRAGTTWFNGCHFEADGRYGPGGEYLLLDRRGWVNRPAMVLDGCTFYPMWTNYDTCIRASGEHGDAALRVNNAMYTNATNGLTFIRDDSPAGSTRPTISVTGMALARGDLATPKLRKRDGTIVSLTENGSQVFS